MKRPAQAAYTPEMNAAAEKLLKGLKASRPDYLTRIARAVSSSRPLEYVGLRWKAYQPALHAEVFEVALNWFRRNGVGNLPKRPLGLLIASMKHRFTDRHRALGSRRRRERPLPEEPHAKGGRSAEGNASAKEELARALRWMKDLPSKQRWPLYYHAFRGLSLEETARALGTTPKAVEKQVAEARRTLRQMYERAGLALPGVARMKKGRRAARKTEPKAKGLRPLRRPRL